MTCLLLITLKAHWLRCFTAASCFKTLQSPKNSLRRLGITARRPSGSCCKRHLHTFHALHFGENVDPCVLFPEAIPAASCSCCLRECAPGAHFMSFLQQKPQNKNRKKIPKLYRAWRELTYHLRGVSIAAEMRRCSTSLISFCNIFIILVYLSFPERLAVFPHNNWSIIHLRLFTDTASCTCWISSG